MKDALMELPKTLSRVQRLSEAHKQSELLHGRANSVLVSTFGVLQSIIDRLSMSFSGMPSPCLQFINTGEGN